jgi:tetratricopeptide (TPR) repeat protein
VPKVIDFGIAKATAGQRLTERTLYTEFRLLIGTPLYMSPEQAEMSAVMDVDTRSDVYSLGVLLYELLTGTTPFDKQRLATAALDEVRRIIREEDPPRPSTRLSTLGATLGTISTRRQTDPKKLGTFVRGELDWIVMKALEKDRARRYETANGLARDVERYLSDQPVEACPPTRMYRLRKFARRNRAVLVAAVVVAVVFVAASVVSTWQALRAQRATTLAMREADHARSEGDKQRAVNDFLNTMLRSASPWSRNASEPSAGKDITVVEAVNAAVARLDTGALHAHPDIEATVRRSIGVTYQALGRLDLAPVQLREALRLSRVAYGEENLEISYSLIELGWCNLYRTPIDWSDVEPHLRQGVEMQKKLLGKSPAIADGLRRLSEMLLRQNKPLEAEKAAREALAVDPAGVLTLANALRDQQRYAEAESLYKQAESDRRKREGENGLATQGYFYELGRLYLAQGKLPEGEAAFTEALAIQHALGMDEVFLREWLARILVAQSKYVEAEQDLREARRLSSRRSDLAFQMANVLQHQSKNAEAAQAVQEGMSLWEEETKQKFASADTPQKRAAIYLSLVDRLVMCRLAKEARDTFQKVVELGSDDAAALNKYAWALVITPRDFYDPALGVQAAQKAIELAPTNAELWNTLGVGLYRTGDYAKAIDALERSRALKPGNDFFSYDAFFLAMAHWQLGHKTAARQWYDRATAWMDKNQPDSPDLQAFRAEAEALLGNVTPTSSPATTHPVYPATAPAS